jgi:hypothetical protein
LEKMMRRTKLRILVAAFAILLIGGLIAGVILARTSAVVAQPDLLVSAERQLETALGIPEEAVGVSTSQNPALSGADTVLQWDGGRAWVDSDTGAIVGLLQERAGDDAKAPFLEDSQLAAAAASFLASVGWDDTVLGVAGFRPDSGGVVSEDAREYTKMWVAYTTQGVRTDGLIQVRLDATSARILAFIHHAGVGDIGTDVSAAISQSEAEAIARKTMEGSLAAQSSTGSAGATASEDNTELRLEEALLKLTDAPGITGGATELIWLVKLVGADEDGCAAGGTVYIDALTGRVVQCLMF